MPIVQVSATGAYCPVDGSCCLQPVAGGRWPTAETHIAGGRWPVADGETCLGGRCDVSRWPTVRRVSAAGETCLGGR
jgi:hypothetical protein